MCGRFSLIQNLHTIASRYDAVYASNLEYNERYNIAPSQQILAVINDGSTNRLGQLRWGLIPFWAKDAKIGYKMINARAETLQEKPAFKHSFKRKRCIIPADSFYEWKAENNVKKPMRIQLKSHEIFSLAGLWEQWEQNGETIYSCTIITTAPNALMEDIHDRMPVILKREDEESWLNRSIEDTDSLKQLLTMYPAEEMEAYEVSSEVNSPKNDNPNIIIPV